MPRQPRGKRTTTADGGIEVVSKNSNGDGSVYFEPPSTSKAGKVRAGGDTDAIACSTAAVCADSTAAATSGFPRA